MDPLTQGMLGAALPQSTITKSTSAKSAKPTTHSKYQVLLAGFLGMLGGMAADIDVLIYSKTDPLLFLEYHRQFTHSLIFIPFGGFIIALLAHGIFRKRWHLQFWQTVAFCTLGYTTHALLDTTTSYGTMLLWPFDETRYSSRIISIIDPLFTVPLGLFVLVAALRNNVLWARLGLAWALIYLGAGWWQHQNAREIASKLAMQRGHKAMRLEVKPSFANILVWKSVYETKDDFFIDAMRVGIEPRVYEGTSVSKLNVKEDFPWLKDDTQQAKDITRFTHFSNGYTALDPKNSNRIIDVRYSFVPNEISALFSIELRPDAKPTKHVQYKTHREKAREKFSQLWHMLTERSAKQ